MNRTTIALLGLFSLAALTSTAEARKRSSLADAPAVRDKIEFRDKRFEVAPTFELSVAHDYKNVYAPGVKLEFHISDSLSIGAQAFYGVATDSGLTSQIEDSLDDTVDENADPTPSKTHFKQHLNEMTIHGGAFATLTPWFGKMALFGKAYVNWDFYLKAGLGFAQLNHDDSRGEWGGADGRVQDVDQARDPMCAPNSDLPQCYTNDRNDGPQNTGFRAGLLVGGGFHIYINKWIAIDLGFANYMFNDNPSGMDFDGDEDVDGDDSRFLSHLFFGVGVAFFLPPKPKITH